MKLVVKSTPITDGHILTQMGMVERKVIEENQNVKECIILSGNGILISRDSCNLCLEMIRRISAKSVLGKYLELTRMILVSIQNRPNTRRILKPKVANKPFRAFLAGAAKCFVYVFKIKFIYLSIYLSIHGNK